MKKAQVIQEGESFKAEEEALAILFATHPVGNILIERFQRFSRQALTKAQTDPSPENSARFQERVLIVDYFQKYKKLGEEGHSKKKGKKKGKK